MLSSICFIDIRGKTSTSSFSSPLYNLLNTSGECLSHYNVLSEEFQQEPKNCPPGLISVDLSPIARIQSTSALPHVQLNISIMVHSEISALFVRLQCLHAPDGEDVYCHNSERMIVGGVWRWPCRGLLVNSLVDVPLVFGYSCFRLYGLSQYYINVTVYPQNCRETFLLTSPLDTQLFPSIANFYDHKNITSFEWSPVIYVDLTEIDGVWFRVAYSKAVAARAIMITVFETSAKNGAIVKKLDSYELIHPSTGVKWLNAAQGTYAVYAYIQRHDCSLLCDGAETCKRCVYTHLNFTLPDDIASLSWKSLRTIRDSGIGVIFLVLAVCLILVIAVSSILYGRRRLIRPLVTDLELNELKKVHIMYSDDCEEHSRVIMEFAKLLESTNCISTTIDQKDLISLDTRPANWLIDSIKNADYILIVVSPLTSVILNGDELVQRRPYPDLFKAGYDLLVNDWSNNIANRKRLSIVTFPYSGSVPHQLAMLHVDTFRVPSQIGELILFVQANPGNNSNQTLLDVSSELLEPLEAAIVAMSQMVNCKPNWKEERIRKMSQPEEMDMSLQRKKYLLNDEERELLHEQLDLLPPDEFDELHNEETAAHFELLERDDTSSDSD